MGEYHSSYKGTQIDTAVGKALNLNIDNALSTTSTNPVQNAVVTTAINNKVSSIKSVGSTTDTTILKYTQNNIEHAVTLSTASESAAGLLSKDDKAKLNKLSTVATSGKYDDLSNKPTIGNGTITVNQNGTSVGEFSVNTTESKSIEITDTTYSPATTSTDGLMSKSDKSKLDDIAAGAEVNVQSDWNTTDENDDTFIKNKPTIPTVNAGVLTIQKNGETVSEFNANESENKTANISVPTKLSELTNDIGFITESEDKDTTYTLTQDSENGHKITLTPSEGTATNITIPDNNTTYTLTQNSFNGHIITLTPSEGDSTTITIPDNDTTYENATTTVAGLMSATDKVKLDDTYTKEETNSLVDKIPKFSVTVVDALPTEDISDTTIYLLKTSESETGNLYTEYIHVNNTWEMLGTQTLDLSQYAKKTDVNNGTLTIKQGTDILGTFTANQSGDTTVTITEGSTSDTKYTLSQDSEDGHKISLESSDGYIKTVTIPDNDTTYSPATDTTDGLMSAIDKVNLDNSISVVSELDSRVTVLENTPIPESTIKTAVDSYVELHSGGFATESELSEIRSTTRNIWTYGDQSITKSIEITSVNISSGTYCLSALITSDATNSSILMYGESGQLFSKALLANSGTRKSVVVSLSETCNRIVICASTSASASTGLTATWSDIQLELGNDATSYVKPYVANDTIAREEVSVIQNTIDLVLDKSINLWTYGDETISQYIKIGDISTIILTADTYAISAICTTDAEKSRMIFYSSDNTNLGYIDLLSSSERQCRVISFSNDVAYLYIYADTSYSASSGKTATWKNIQIEKNIYATPYVSNDATALDGTSRSEISGIVNSIYGGYNNIWEFDDLIFTKLTYIGDKSKEILPAGDYSLSAIVTTAAEKSRIRFISATSYIDLDFTSDTERQCVAFHTEESIVQIYVFSSTDSSSSEGISATYKDIQLEKSDWKCYKYSTSSTFYPAPYSLQYMTKSEYPTNCTSFWSDKKNCFCW